MAAAVYGVYHLTAGRFTGFAGNVVVLAACGITGIAVYGALLWVLKVEEIRSLLNRK